MNTLQPPNKDQYYTNDHEWITFQGAVAYVGICPFKLTGFKEVEEIKFTDPSGFKKQGDVIATVKYKDWQVEAHMPVDGKVLQVNEKLITGDSGLLLESAEGEGWIALIVPSLPAVKNSLMLPDQYQQHTKMIHAR